MIRLAYKNDTIIIIDHGGSGDGEGELDRWKTGRQMDDIGEGERKTDRKVSTSR